MLAAASVVGLAALSGAVSSAGAVAGADSTTTTTNPWVPGKNGTLTIGIDQAPTGCNPNTASGDRWADRLILEPVLPSSFVVNQSDQPVYDSAVITQAELQSTSPQTVVYTINPKAVWSDGKPITAADFIYAWEEERGSAGPVGPVTGVTKLTASTSSGERSAVAGAQAATPTVTTLPGATGTTGPSLGYRQIASMKPSNHGRMVTVVFSTPYADWQSLFDFLLPAHLMAKTGWDPRCTTVDPSIDLSGGPFEIARARPSKIVLVRNPRWWEQQPELARIVIRIASGPAQLAHWMADGAVDAALPTGFGTGYLQAVTSDPAVGTQAQISTTFLELQFSTTSAQTSAVDVREAIAHAVDRQSLVNTVVGWANSSIVPAASFLYAQTQNDYPGPRPVPLQVSGQPGYSSTTTTSKTSVSTSFPSTASLAITGKLLGNLGYIKSATGIWEAATGKAVSFRMAVDDADPWASETAPLIVKQLAAAGIPVTQVGASSAQAAGEDLSMGRADMALLPMHSSPYPSQAIAWYTTLLGKPGTAGSQDWSNLADPSVDSLLEKASRELNPVTAAPIYTDVDTLLWQDMVGLPLFAEPSLLATSGLTYGISANSDGPSLMWSPGSWAMRVPPSSVDAAGS